MFDFTNNPEAGADTQTFTPNQQKVLDWLENGGDDRTFQMSMWVSLDFKEPKDRNSWCGTACCIGGFIDTLDYQSPGDYLARNEGRNYSANAAWLGLSAATGNQLFFPNDDYQTRCTPQQAAQALRNAIRLDDPCWDEVMEG